MKHRLSEPEDQSAGMNIKTLKNYVRGWIRRQKRILSQSFIRRWSKSLKERKYTAAINI